MQTVNATIRGISPQALLVDVGGEQGTIGLTARTELTVRGTVERDVLQPGALVTASGYIREGGVMKDAIVTVDFSNPRWPQRNVEVKQSEPLATVHGRVISLDPLAIVSLDGLVLVGEQVQENVPPPKSRPAFNQRFTLELKDAGKPLKATFGAAPALIAEGDSARITVPQNGPRVATRVEVQREATLTREDLAGSDEKTPRGRKSPAKEPATANE